MRTTPKEATGGPAEAEAAVLSLGAHQAMGMETKPTPMARNSTRPSGWTNG